MNMKMENIARLYTRSFCLNHPSLFMSAWVIMMVSTRLCRRKRFAAWYFACSVPSSCSASVKFSCGRLTGYAISFWHSLCIHVSYHASIFSLCMSRRNWWLILITWLKFFILKLIYINLSDICWALTHNRVISCSYQRIA